MAANDAAMPRKLLPAGNLLILLGALLHQLVGVVRIARAPVMAAAKSLDLASVVAVPDEIAAWAGATAKIEADSHAATAMDFNLINLLV